MTPGLDEALDSQAELILTPGHENPRLAFPFDEIDDEGLIPGVIPGALSDVEHVLEVELQTDGSIEVLTVELDG